MNNVGQWLDGLGLARYADLFAEHEIDGEVLPDLTDEDLEKLGIPLGARKKLVKAIASLPAEGAESVTDRSQAASEAERRQLTVMFCDLVGSTELSERLDPEQLRDVIGAYQEASAETIKAFEGFIARYMGDGLLVYFGYPQAHEDDAERAVRAGLGIIDAVGRLGPADDIELRVRIGIATGLVVAGDIVGEGASEERAVLGETPNLAARLQGLAEPDTVVIAGATLRLVEGLFVCDDLGPRSLKGISQPVSAFRVRAESGAPSRFEASAVRGLTPLVGRRPEIDLLLDRWQRAKDGEGQVVLLSGEAGIGKSRIVRGFQERIEGEPRNRVLYFCSPYHQNSALYPVIDQFTRALRLKPDDEPGRKLNTLEATLADLGLSTDEIAPLLASVLSLPVEERYPPLPLDPQVLRRATLEALVTVIEAMAARHPVLMAVEDAHWIDPSTQELLGLYIERLRSAAVLLVITFRPEFTAPWSEHAHLTALALSRLSRRECVDLIARVASNKPLPEEVLERIIERTDGVPLYVEELTRTVLETDLLEDAGDRYVLTGPLPPLAIPASLQDSLMSRLDRLAPVKEVAQLAAMLGRTFSFGLLAAVSPLPDDELEEALSRLVETGLVYRRGLPPDASYEFKHALVQDTAYESLLKSTRLQNHRRIAEALEEHFPETADAQPELLAHHFTEAGLTEEAVVYWHRAGRRAIRNSANLEAVSHFTKGVELLMKLPESGDRDRQELDLLTGLGPALMTTKGFAYPEVGRILRRAYDVCDQSGVDEHLFRIAWNLWLHHHVAGNLEQASGWSDEVVRLADASASEEHRLEAHHAVWTTAFSRGDQETVRQHCESGIAIYAPERHHDCTYSYGAHDPGVCGHAHAGLALLLLGFPDQALTHGRKAITLAESVSHGPSITVARGLFCFLCAIRRDPEALLLESEQALAAAERYGPLHFRSFAQCGYGWALVALGHGENGLAEAEAGIDFYKQTGATLRLPNFLSLLADIHLALGALSEALSAVDDALRLIEHDCEGTLWAEATRLKAEILLAQSSEHNDAAEALFRQAIQVATRQSARLLALRSAAGLARHWRDQGRIAEAHELLSPILVQFTEGFDAPDLVDASALLDELVR